jgi:hypothetical protein
MMMKTILAWMRQYIKLPIQQNEVRCAAQDVRFMESSGQVEARRAPSNDNVAGIVLALRVSDAELGQDVKRGTCPVKV